MARGLFVTGTDTGVGKTRVGCTLLAAAHRMGADVGTMKPIETGVDARGPLDAIALKRAAHVTDPLDEICPQQFAMPAAPNVAATAEGRTVDLDLIEARFAALAERHAAMLVEGAGGLFVPTRDDSDMGDLAAALALPVLVVARAALGTINHTLLTLAELERRELPLVGVVISHATDSLPDADVANLGQLRDVLGKRLLGELPFSDVPDPAEVEVPETLQLERLLERLV